MKALIRIVAAGASLASGLAVAQGPVQNPPAQVTPERTHRWWTDRPAGGRYTADAQKLPVISVKGNKFVDPEGNAVLFRGVAISDPDKLQMQGHWSRDHFARVKDMGAKLVRIPVHPVAWRERTPAEYLKLLDQAVEWCTDLEMYIDLDWHSIGNLTTGLFQDPMYETSQQETYSFWRTVARHFAGHHTIAFFELFNEPTTYNNQLGPVNWMEWKREQEDLIAIIRAYNPQVIPLVAGFDWAYDLTPLRLAPINAEGIGYVTHPYAAKRPQPWEPRWEEDFGFAAAKYPVVATEFGGFGPARPGPSAGGEGAAPAPPELFGPAIIKYLEGKGISWVVWCFDPEWRPSLISNWEYQLTPSGEFARKAMQGAMK